MKYQKTYGQEGSIKEIICPRCLTRWSVPIEKLAGKHRFKARCQCNFVFPVEYDMREKYRRQSNLEAFVELVDRPEKWGKVISDSETAEPQSVNSMLNNISSSNIGLTVFRNNQFKVGDHIRIKLTLNDSKGSKIEKKAIVRRVEGNSIGCEFFQKEKNDKTLSFYFLS